MDLYRRITLASRKGRRWGIVITWEGERMRGSLVSAALWVGSFGPDVSDL